MGFAQREEERGISERTKNDCVETAAIGSGLLLKTAEKNRLDFLKSDCAQFAVRNKD